jgi:hypothetical protein
MMNNILFNKQVNKHAKKNIYIKCSHILHNGVVSPTRTMFVHKVRVSP